MTIKAIVHEEGGGFWAEVPAIPGCVTEGDSMDSLTANLWEAIEGWTESRRDFDQEARVACATTDRLEIVQAASVSA